mmetsp:Transcript_31024/g.79800  ORF Transcript_31024/g.79800 Transcript_31024/m.79800 type:complete len:198 (-) Transcript_31024:6-599(-)
MRGEVTAAAAEVTTRAAQGGAAGEERAKRSASSAMEMIWVGGKHGFWAATQATGANGPQHTTEALRATERLPREAVRPETATSRRSVAAEKPTLERSVEKPDAWPNGAAAEGATAPPVAPATRLRGEAARPAEANAALRGLRAREPTQRRPTKTTAAEPSASGAPRGVRPPRARAAAITEGGCVAKLRRKRGVSDEA